MAPLSLKIVQDGGAVTRKIKLDPNLTVAEATEIVKEKANLPPDAKAYGLFLRSLDSDLSGIWLENDKKLSDYLLRDGDQLDYMSKIRNLRLRMLDDTVKTFQVDQSKLVSDLMFSICSKIGITNHEEYGMCLDQEDEPDDGKDKPAGHTGTLTLKKRSKLEERDLEFEQLSKKLKTDDNVDWVDCHKTLSEAGVPPTQTLLLKRRLFYSDRNVDSRDPIQLNLLYVQARDNILNSRHPVTEAKAAEFAGIQCQIQFGDYNEEKHKPGFIENLSEYLPEQYCSSWGIEKKILKEYSTHSGLNELDAKHLYTKTARALPTYGVTFFLVKEKQKGKKKLVPRLLGINAEAILRLDETTKEIIQTWPLTHVKTYYAGKGETFTLNFGDYMDKEYSVKTRDAFRIRDILEGYIDLIRKRMLAHYNISGSDHGYVGQDNVCAGQATVMQHITNNPSKIVEHSFVGPSKIVECVPGQVATQGTQVVTAQQMLINEIKNKQGQGVMKAEVGMRQDMGIPFTRRLNRLNSNSVQIVTLLTEPSKAHIEDTQKIVDVMNGDMPSIRDGVIATIAKQINEEEKKKLQDQLNELNELMKTLTQSTEPATPNASEAEDAAKRIASLSTEMYFAIAPETRRRSRILSKTRTSFIADEKTEKNLRRASFIAASATANHALDSAAELAQEPYRGPALSPQKVEELERDAVDKLGKLNAAIAHFMMAHTDPQNIDYATSVNSLNTIHELMPDLARDAQALASVKDGKERTALINDVKELIGAARQVCSLSGVEDPKKMQDASSSYADASGRLVYVFGKRRAKPRVDKENQILELADAVVEKTAALLKSTQTLTYMAVTEPAAGEVDEAASKTAAAAKNLHVQAVLNSPTIDEPHCQSALTAASEALSSSAQQLAVSWKPVAEHPSRRILGEKLHNQTMELAKALDKLTEAYSSGDANVQDVKRSTEPVNEAQRLQFINSLSKIGGNWKAAEDDLNKPLKSSVADPEAKEAQRRLAGRIAQLNAALASLLSATSDRENPDYATAESAIATINELLPELVKDSKTASANYDPASKAALLADVKALCAATKNVSAGVYSADPEALNEALIQFTNTSGKLTYVCNSRANPDREAKIIDLTSSACAQAGVLLSGVQQLSEGEGGVVGERLDAQGAALADAAQTLLTTAQVTAASISDPRCQSTLLLSIDKVSSSGKELEDTWAPLKKDPKLDARLLALHEARKQLEKQLKHLRDACQIPDNEVQDTQELQTSEGQTLIDWKQDGQTVQDGPQQEQKLQFIATMRGTKDKLADAQKELNKPAMPATVSDMHAVQQRLTHGLEQLNAAIAALLAATADHENPDCATAEQAAHTISKLMPQLIKDCKTASTTMEEPARAAMLAEIKALCYASQGICASAYGDPSQQNINDEVGKFGNASEKLMFVVNPRKPVQKKDEIVNLSNAACAETSALLSGVQQLAQGVGGARGQQLDVQGGRVASAAHNMLQSARILSPMLQSPQCQKALLSSVDNVSTECQQLASSLAPLQDDHKHGPKAKDALQALQRLDSKLNTMRAACEAPDVGVQGTQEQQKMQFIKTIEATKGKWAGAEKELKKPVTPARGTDVAAVEERLSSRLAALDAAVAALLAATSDRDKPNYVEAEKSVKAISELLPHVIQDTKTVCASKEEPERAAMLAEIKALCDASQGICASSYGTDVQGLNDAVGKYSDASGKLVYVVNPRKSLKKQNEIVNLTSAACGESSALLSDVQDLAKNIGGARAHELDIQGLRLADQAQNLLQTVQITAPSLSSPECRSALLSSVDTVSNAGKQLAASVAPLQDDSKHSPMARKILQALQRLQSRLETLKGACGALDVDTQGTQEQQKLQFVKTIEATKGKWAEAQKELKKPVTPVRGAEVDAVEERLSTRLAALDAAVAALLAATSDREKPDYKEAEKSVKTISELLPHVIQDTKKVCSSKDEPARTAMLAEIKALCDASQAICASSYGTDTQGLNDAVAKFSDASGKLVYVANPRKNMQKPNEVVNLAGTACGETSSLLTGVQQLAQDVGGARGRELDALGGRLADQAQNLLQTVQITAPSLSSPECRSALVSSVDNVSNAAKNLSASITPLREDSKHGPKARDSLQALQILQTKLETLKAACSAPDISTQASQEQQKLQFMKTIEATKVKWADADKELKKPVTAARDANMDAVQTRLSQRLAALDAAVAALLAATSDRDKPDYATAEKSVKTISELLPHVVQDTKTVCASKDDPARAAMLAEIKALCDASQGVCASSYGTDTQGLNDAVAKYSDASGKLVYVVNPRKNLQKQNEVVNLAGAACAETSGILSGIQQLAQDVGGARGRELDTQGGRLADQAHNLLQTVQITAPSLSSPECRSVLLSSVDSMSNAGHQMKASLASIQDDSKHGPKAKNALEDLKRLDSKLAALKVACGASDIGSQATKEQQKLQFIKTIEATKEKWVDVEKELKKPLTPARGSDVDVVQARLSERLTALDAAVAALLAATSDRDKADFAKAVKSVKTISGLLPHIIQDTKTVCASKDEPTRTAMLAEVKALCDASQGICGSTYGANIQNLNDNVAKFADASSKLVYIANPRVNSQKEKEVVNQAGDACGTTAALLSGVQVLAEAVGGAQGRELDAQGGRVADAAQNLLHTAQITAPSLSSPECRAAMLSSVDNMSHSAAQLTQSLAAVSADPKHAQQLSIALKQLQDQLDRLRKTCNAPDTTPSVSKQPPPLPTSKPPTIAHASPYRGANVDATQDFLDRMRCEESTARQPSSATHGPAVVGGVGKVKPPPSARYTDDEKQRQVFVKSLEDAEQTIKKHEAGLMKQCRAPSGTGPALSHRDMMQKQTQLQRHLAQAGIEVASLVAANYADNIDYTTALKSTKALPELMTNIVEEGTQLSDNLNDMARKAFLYDMLQMCEASRKICDAAGTDRQKLNDAAVHFGDASTKLLYVVSSDVDPALEKEIISRAKAIGDSASRLALDAADIATAASGTAAGSAAPDASPVQDICDAGTACVDAAGKLVYTAKLTAPSIHERPCQDALVSSTNALSAKLRSFADSWKPLESDPEQAKTISHLSAEAAKLESILEGLRSDVREGSIGRRRELEHLVVENTPIRELTVKILDEAKLHAESSSMPTPQKIAYAAYADKLTDALRALDLANARCKKTPHDTNKRRDLEAAIQNLQMILLQSRPSREDKGNTNIVDLMDFMEEVSAEAKNVSAAARNAKVPTPQDMLTLEEIKDQCDTIATKANQLITGEIPADVEFNDLFDQFGQECDDVIKQLTKEATRMEDAKTKNLLLSKIMALSESCNMLRFATKSGISTEACATLDASLDELDDIEDRVIQSLVQDAAVCGVTLRSKKAPVTGHSKATLNLCREVTSSPTGVAASTVTAYIADAASKADPGNPEENNKLMKHLYKLVHLLKTLTVTSSKRAATWQQVDGPETAKITEQILQEIRNPESKFGMQSEDKKQNILDDDIEKLLIPSAPKILGDRKQQEVKLTQLASDLSVKCGELSAEPSSATLARDARVAANAARELDAIVRGTVKPDPVHRRKIDEASKEMLFCTYNVLKSAESSCMEPKNSALKRRLADALQNLNNSIDKLVWHASSAPVLQRACGALSRGTQAQLAALQPRVHSSAPFTDTCDLIIKQHENISKLKNDQPMPRVEFMQNLDDIGTAVRTSVDNAAQCAYYIAISEQHKDVAKAGIADVPKIQRALESIQDSCMTVISSNEYEQAKEHKEELHRLVQDFSDALDKAQLSVNDGEVKKTLVRAKSCVNEAAEGLESRLARQTSMDQVTPKAITLLEAVNQAYTMVEQCPLVPTVGTLSKETKEKCDEVMNNSKSLLTNTLALLKDVNSAPEEPDMMTWVTFNTNRKKLLDAYDALVKSVRRNGHRAGIYEKAPEEDEKEEPRKSYIETQVDLANKWLKSPTSKTEVKVIGQQAARNVIDIARQMSEDLKGSEREEVRNVIAETEELLSECTKKYNHEKNSVLMDRLKELRKCIQRGVVTRVVEDFIEAEAPLADLDLLTDIEQDESKRKFILERKIASLLAQLGRVTKTARFVANASQNQSIGVELSQSSEQTELLAPMLVKAAQQRIDHPNDKMVIENYKALLAQYAESISKVRDLCDRAVDPMDFVQTAGDTMQRMREEVAQSNSDPQKCAYTSNAITKLANRVINVSMSSNAVASDPELQNALIAAKQRLHAVTPAPNTRASRLPDWRDTTAEILRTTGDVESALGGENIFKREPTTANQPIYSVARDLHESVREWSSKDNEIVGVARRMAVLMARLSEYMETDKTDALLTTSKSIVFESQEVTELAKKLAHECSDVRIKTNLLQTCERIPTISGQLKMLTAVKASSLGRQGLEEDKEAMDMLVGNAQSLMLSIQEVVKAAASASVKIMSQRGPRLRWVRKNYY